jgi:hypothetical protein
MHPSPCVSVHQKEVAMKLRFLLAASAVFACMGCLMQMPMPKRLNAENQAEFDAGWNKALSPVDRLDRQRWLDILVGAHAYQWGVDKLWFHSEKKFSGGHVAMENSLRSSRPGRGSFSHANLRPGGKAGPPGKLQARGSGKSAPGPAPNDTSE